jgi:hypothetical protein
VGNKSQVTGLLSQNDEILENCSQSSMSDCKSDILNQENEADLTPKFDNRTTTAVFGS